MSIKKISEQDPVLESIGLIIFESYLEKLQNMDTLIVGLQGFMNFFFTKKKLLRVKADLEQIKYGEGIEKAKSYLRYESRENLDKLEIKVDKLLRDYEVYIRTKQEARAHRKNNPR